jgi:hypothetical protein
LENFQRMLRVQIADTPYCSETGGIRGFQSRDPSVNRTAVIDDEKYISIPDKRELNLGKPLALDFAREFLADDYDEVRQIFSRRGAYRRYKELLVRRGALERWYDFSNKSEETALREWCAENGIELSEA